MFSLSSPTQPEENSLGSRLTHFWRYKRFVAVVVKLQIVFTHTVCCIVQVKLYAEEASLNVPEQLAHSWTWNQYLNWQKQENRLIWERWRNDWRRRCGTYSTKATWGLEYLCTLYNLEYNSLYIINTSRQSSGLCSSLCIVAVSGIKNKVEIVSLHVFTFLLQQMALTLSDATRWSTC